MKTILASAAMVAALCTAGMAQEAPRPETPKDSTEIRNQIQELQGKLGRLIAEERNARRAEEQRRVLTMVQERSRARTEQFAQRAKQLQAAAGPPAAEQDEYNRAFLAHVSAIAKVDAEIVAIGDPGQLAKVRQLEDVADGLDSEWDLVTEPMLSGRMLLASARIAAKDLPTGNLADRARQIEAVQAQDQELAGKQLTLWKDRRSSMRKIQALIESFWVAVDKAQADAGK
jgi:hypothetical protein